MKESTMKKTILALLLLISISSFAQIPEDVLRYSWQPVNGTARVNAIGGAMGSLGGDITATFTNPAGLAMYRTSDFVLSPGFSFLSNKSAFRGTSMSANNSNFNLGPTGFVGGLNSRGKWKNSAISFAVTRTANFSDKISYSGLNNFSSFGEQYAAEAANSGLSIQGILSPTSNVSLGTKMALYTYFTDTASVGGTSPDFVSVAMYDNLKNGGAFLVKQSQTIETSGGITEAAIGYAGNMNDKFYLGGSLGIPIVRYEKNTILREEDATGDNANYFNFSELRETYNTKGFGLNLKLGMILKPVEKLRLGLAVHSPTVYTLTDRYHATLSADLENYRSVPGVYTSNSNDFNGGETPRYEYDFNTPWKFLFSGAYVINEVADVTKQKGFITAEVEYLASKSNKFKNSDGNDEDYYTSLNDVIRSYYKNTFNMRVGGELKFNTIMGRLGFAYYGNPYADNVLKASKMFVSGGVGYRNGGMFIDLSYVQGLQKDVNFPYRLPDKANTYSTMKTSQGNVMVTVGFKI